MSINRYPGPKPFQEEQADIFFGRQEAIQELYELVLQEDLVVLFAKSGLGKTSLIKAGVMPTIRKEGRFIPLYIRFFAYTGAEVMPLVKTKQSIQSLSSTYDNFLNELIEEDNSLWRTIKNLQLDPAGGPLILFFDQFEEFFTYPKIAQLRFRRELAEALNTTLPQSYLDVLGLFPEGQTPITKGQEALLGRALNTSIVFSIRQDRIHYLKDMADYLPSISKNWYELEALDRKSAANAIKIPASLDGDFNSPKFSYSEEAMDILLDFLTNNNKDAGIASTQLQILCNTIEEKVIKEKLSLINKEDFGKPKKIIEDYYIKIVNAIENPATQLAVRKLIEEELIFEKEQKRLSLYEGLILSNYKEIDANVIKKLSDSHIIRAEPNIQGGFNYELSHDTLVEPVLEAKAKRVKIEEEKKEEERLKKREEELARLRAEAEKERKRAEAEKKLRQIADEAQKKANKRTWQVTIALVLSVLLGVLAVVSAINSNKNKRTADENATKANNLYDKVRESSREYRDLLVDDLKEEALQFMKAGENSFAIKRYQEAKDLIESDTLLERSDYLEVEFLNEQIDSLSR